MQCIFSYAVLTNHKMEPNALHTLQSKQVSGEGTTSMSWIIKQFSWRNSLGWIACFPAALWIETFLQNITIQMYSNHPGLAEIKGLVTVSCQHPKWLHCEFAAEFWTFYLKTDHLSNAISEANGDQRKLYSIIQSLTCVNKDNPLPEHESVQQLADIFADFFI